MPTLLDIMPDLRRRDSAFIEHSVPAEAVRFESEQLIVNDGEAFRVAPDTRRRLFDAAGAPGRYLVTLRCQTQNMLLTELFSTGQFGAVADVVVRRGEVHTVVPHRLLNLKYVDVINAVTEGLEEDSGSLFVARIVNTQDRLEVDILGEHKSFAVRPGDIVRGGLHITHDRFGAEATHIQSFVLRLICSNGMTRRECVSRGGPRTRKLSVNHPNARNLQLEQVKRLAAEVWRGIDAKLEELPHLTPT